MIVMFRIYIANYKVGFLKHFLESVLVYFLKITIIALHPNLNPSRYLTKFFFINFKIFLKKKLNHIRVHKKIFKVSQVIRKTTSWLNKKSFFYLFASRKNEA